MEVQLEDHRPAFRDKGSYLSNALVCFLFFCGVTVESALGRVLSTSPLQATALSCELSPETGIKKDAMTKITLLGKLKLQPYQCMWDGSRPV